MDAEQVMLIMKQLTIKEFFKVWRMVNTTMSLVSNDVLRDIEEREPELFEPYQIDKQGYIRFPWQKEYKR